MWILNEEQQKLHDGMKLWPTLSVYPGLSVLYFEEAWHASEINCFKKNKATSVIWAETILSSSLKSICIGLIDRLDWLLVNFSFSELICLVDVNNCYIYNKQRLT